VNILHIDEQRTWRGGEQQASSLIQGLARRGHRNVIAGRPGSPFLRAEHGGAPLERLALPFASEADPYTAWQLARAVKRHDIDILHAHTSHAHMAAYLANRLSGRAKVVVSRRVGFSPRGSAFSRWKYTLPDRFLAVSAYVGRVLEAYGVAPEQIRLVHSTVDTSRFDVPPVTRETLGVPEGVPLLFTAGALVGHKDHATMVSAMARVVAAIPEARLLIAGEGVLRPALEAQILQLGLGQCVRLLGHRDDVPGLLRAADLYVFSSWSEGLGSSVLEAMACELPVVATDAEGVVGEMVEDGVTGRLAPSRDPRALADAVAASLRNPEQARAMAQAARRMLETRFVVDRMVEGTLAAYAELLGRDEAEAGNPNRG